MSSVMSTDLTLCLSMNAMISRMMSASRRTLVDVVGVPSFQRLHLASLTLNDADGRLRGELVLWTTAGNGGQRVSTHPPLGSFPQRRASSTVFAFVAHLFPPLCAGGLHCQTVRLVSDCLIPEGAKRCECRGRGGDAVSFPPRRAAEDAEGGRGRHAGDRRRHTGTRGDMETWRDGERRPGSQAQAL